MTLTEQILTQLPGNPLSGLRRADLLWRSLQQGNADIPSVVQESSIPLGHVDWDVVICGGTLGILLGAVLVQRGWRVALLERGKLRGREQEWNISRKELTVLVALELLTEAELATAIATEYNPARISFAGGPDFWVRDVLNLGVDPIFLLETLKQRFLAAGGKLFEETAFAGVTVHPNGVVVQSDGAAPRAGQTLTTRLVLDAMGHFSPIVQQARQGQKPDGVCLVVGTCAQGFPNNDSGDLIASFTPLQNQCQYFWEAFPARDGRTTYLFTYVDAHPDRLSLETLFEEYLRLLPDYQNVKLENLTWKRALFGFFPCYRNSPLKPTWDRILPVGDSSSNQSPLSFGGFGAMMRHLQRLSDGIQAALQQDALDRSALSALQPYQPNLAVTWLFQRAMSVGVNQKIAPNQINDLLTGVFQEMVQLGDPVLKPFLQDVVQFPGLFKTLMRTAVTHPGLVVNVIPQVGLPALLDWTVHYVNLAGYTLLYPLGKRLVARWNKTAAAQPYYLNRQVEAWQYGSGNDYSHK
ncbi:MAG: FAD-binding oxidoreductase [Scytolyngbya sp. HA4215-MV1]|jgi:lycopene cyclase CruP|nr:FAD-binding oxidoreductase [Scytolyngbya sp. HA4215-MV1]